MSKQIVEISLTSRQEDGGLEEVTRQTHEGVLYQKEGADYLLYTEAAEGINTSIRLDPQEIRLYRRGEHSSWQAFQLGEFTGGMLTIGAGEMVLRIHTSHFSLEQGERAGRMALHYEMWTSSSADPAADPYDVSLGRFVLDMDWRVKDDAEEEA